MNNDRFDELQELLGAVRDGAATEAQMARLDHLLATDAEARQLYLEYMDLCSTLRHYQGRLNREIVEAKDDPFLLKGNPSTLSRPKRRWAAVMKLAIAAMLLLSIGFAGAFLWYAKHPPAGLVPEAQLQAEGPGVAVLTRVVGVEWENSKLALPVGSALPLGQLLKLKSGLVQLEFYSGATVVLEGPADFELLAIDKAYCRQGKLRAKVLPSAHGFAIETPKVRLVDLGTEFGLNVEASGAADVHVFDGKVELSGEDDGRSRLAKQQVSTGRGAHIDESGVSHQPKVRPDSFVGVAELEGRLTREAQRRYQAWSDASQKLAGDPRLVLYYSFEGQARWDRTLQNHGPVQQPALNGAIVGCEWIDGRWPGKGALEFKRPSDRIRLHIPGEYEAMTWMAWVRVDALDQRYNALLLTDGFELGAPHWQLTSKGQLRLGIRYAKEDRSYHNYDSAIIYTPDQLGQWKHLATVYDAEAGLVQHFVNGQLVGERELKASMTLSIGNVEIGNWGVPLTVDPNPIRNLNGRMDEFLLWRQALSAAEIRKLYQAGEPMH